MQSPPAGQGRGAALRRLLRKCMQPIASWHTLLFYERDLTTFVSRDVKAKIPLEIRPASRRDFQRFADMLRTQGLGPAEIEERLRRGDVCFIGVSLGRLVNFTWLSVTRAWVPEIAATVVLGPDEGYIYKSFTEAAARGNAVQPAVTAALTRYEQSRQLKRHFYYISRENAPGLRIRGKLSGEMAPCCRVVRRIRIVGFRGYLLTGVSRPGRPTLELPPSVAVRRLGPLGNWISPVRD